jgi:hypothetical protein
MIEEIVDAKIKKIKSGFRYRLIDLLFKPWDYFKKYNLFFRYKK